MTRNLFPGAGSIEHNNEDYLVVHHDIPQTVMLKALGYNVPNPMLLYYNWHGGTPFSVQRRTVDMMTTAQRCYILNSMGTGKTKAALWAWDYLNGNRHVGKMLVVGTLSTLKFVWQAEAFRTMPHRKVSILHGTRKQRLERLDYDADIYVINHDGLKTIAEELSARTDIDVALLGRSRRLPQQQRAIQDDAQVCQAVQSGVGTDRSPDAKRAYRRLGDQQSGDPTHLATIFSAGAGNADEQDQPVQMGAQARGN